MKQFPPLLAAALLLAGPALASDPKPDLTRYDEFVDVIRTHGCSMAEPEAEVILGDQHGFEKDQVKVIVDHMIAKGGTALVEQRYYEPTRKREVFLVLSESLCGAG